MVVSSSVAGSPVVVSSTIKRVDGRSVVLSCTVTCACTLAAAKRHSAKMLVLSIMSCGGDQGGRENMRAPCNSPGEARCFQALRATQCTVVSAVAMAEASNSVTSPRNRGGCFEIVPLTMSPCALATNPSPCSGASALPCDAGPCHRGCGWHRGASDCVANHLTARDRFDSSSWRPVSHYC